MRAACSNEDRWQFLFANLSECSHWVWVPLNCEIERIAGSAFPRLAHAAKQSRACSHLDHTSSSSSQQPTHRSLLSQAAYSFGHRMLTIESSPLIIHGRDISRPCSSSRKRSTSSTDLALPLIRTRSWSWLSVWQPREIHCCRRQCSTIYEILPGKQANTVTETFLNDFKCLSYPQGVC